ncbi:iron dependent repressor, metal binding and dimerization domain protein [Arthrobacter sp. Leaf137]|uniref:iron dependent repressor, metal binding and dimerization domain protein n=1 Tax=Arthrobacter sp. Leaf137 TaxID=1736271 RepID=UPI0019105D29
MLGYGRDEVHDEADVLEHAGSENLVARIDQLFGHPYTRPPRVPDSFEAWNPGRRQGHPLVGRPGWCAADLDADRRYRSCPAEVLRRAGAAARGEADGRGTLSLMERPSGSPGTTRAPKSGGTSLCDLGHRLQLVPQAGEIFRTVR